MRNVRNKQRHRRRRILRRHTKERRAPFLMHGNRIQKKRNRTGLRFNRIAAIIGIVTGTLYAAALLALAFSGGGDPSETAEGFQWIPFARPAEYIEDAIRGEGSLKMAVSYLAYRILLFIPCGMYLSVLLKNRLVWLRLLLMTAIPAAVELIQLCIAGRGANIDDVILGVVGGIVGVLFCRLAERLCIRFAGRHFL